MSADRRWAALVRAALARGERLADGRVVLVAAVSEDDLRWLAGELVGWRQAGLTKGREEAQAA